MTKWMDGGITAAEGFEAAGVACGIKASEFDLALIASGAACSAAGVFTVNRAAAAPVLLSRRNLAATGGRARGIVANSGCANACTGAQGDAVAQAMADETARQLGCSPDEVLIASTGVIGVSLDQQVVCAGIRQAVRELARNGHDRAARAIMTTDLHPKERAVEVELPAGSVRIGGIAKGAGMIEPMLATMLAFVTTDAAIDPPMLQDALERAVAVTFNAITVDGECSTNDTVLALASGRSGVTVTGDTLPLFVNALRDVCRALALEIVRGGEGATRLLEVVVTGASSATDAQRAARTIANSPLVKTAVHGGDPNWGRVVAAAGRAGVEFDVASASIRIGQVALFERGVPHDDRAADAARVLAAPEVTIEVDLGTGGAASARIWTCDLSAEYVRINADYRS